MAGGTHTIEALADWAAELRVTDVPDDVVELGRAQRRSVLAAVAAAGGDGATTRVVDAVERWAGEGPVPLLGRERRVDLEAAVYAAAAASVALDFDDYLCFGHTGHSAALTPMLAAAETGSGGTEQLTAQIAADEVEARLGGAILLGPMNGQLWAYIHAAGAAIAYGRMMGLPKGRLAHALAIALAHPTRATVPGFMAPDTKLLVAAEPTAAGVRAARLAEAGVTGPLDALDHPRGALEALSFAPLREVLGGLGTGWATRTLSVKPYPGCAYVDTTVDALSEILDGDPAIRAGTVEEVTVEGGTLTCGMDALSEPYTTALDPPTPVTVTFSVPWNVAIVLLAGRLTEQETRPEWLAEHADELRALARRVRLRHDTSLTAETGAAFAPLLPVRAVVREVGPRRLLSALREVRAEHPSGIGIGDVPGLVRAAREARRSVTGPGPPDGDGWWRPEALERFRVTFPSRVVVRTSDGTRRTSTVAVPRGGAGNAAAPPAEVAREKLARCGPALWGEDGTARIDEAVATDDDELHTLLHHETSERP